MYQFTEAERQSYEALPIPVAVYQHVDGQVVTVLVSDGFCRMWDMPRETLVGVLDSSMFASVHPEDAGRVARLGEEFAQGRSDYDVIYRSRQVGEADYHVVHAVARWRVMPDGSRLAFMMYNNLSQSMDDIERIAESYQLFHQDQFYNDPVSGLPNLNYLHQFADETVNKLRSLGETPALLYFDVKAMQFYNAQYGFARGDALLALIGSVLRDEFPDSLVARGPDDHFIVITPFTGEERLAGKITEANARVKAGAEGNAAGIQAGVYRLDAGAKSMDAMGRAKHALREIGDDMNVVYRFFSHSTEERYWEERYIVETFGQALEQGWIKVFYQAIMRVSTGKACVFEALARWVDPTRGLISPAKFIPILDKYHLLYRLDLYMAEQVCREYAQRAELGLGGIPASINFSAQDFDHADVAASLNDILARYGVSRDSIVVEITEQDIATATERFQGQLAELRKNGYRLWVDDFGSGYSSLNVFSKFDFDRIKFDLELLKNLDAHDGANRHIMRAMVGVAEKTGIHTLAEGMEDERQLQFLREIGCELAQGFFFHKPEPLDAIAFKLKNNGTGIPCE